MNWDSRIFLYLLFFVPVVGVLLFFLERRRYLKFKNIIKAENIYMVSGRKITVKRGLFLMAAFFALLAAAGPRWGSRWQKVRRPANDIIFLIDSSASMQAADIKPSRSAAAKKKVRILAHDIPASRAGLVFFAGTAFVQCPVTFDKNAVNIFLNEAWENLIPLPGSNIEKALSLAIDSFPSSEKVSKKFIILITDGEELQGNYRNAVRNAEENNVEIIAYSFGTMEGAPIPVYENSRLTGYKKNPAGETVISRADKTLMEEIASASGGIFVNYSQSTGDINRIINKISGGVRKKKEEDILLPAENRYQYPLLIAVILLLADFLISERKKNV